MKDPQYFYRMAEKKGIAVIPFPLPKTGSLSIQAEDGKCSIGIDQGAMETTADETVHLAHEMGHCVRGAFYNRWAACDIRQRQENKADKWAIQRLITREALDKAVAAGLIEIWELAEEFNVTEDFMKKAMCWYQHGTLATEMYF